MSGGLPPSWPKLLRHQFLSSTRYAYIIVYWTVSDLVSSFISGQFYFYLGFQEAAEQCTSQSGGHLASFEDDKEAELLKEFLRLHIVQNIRKYIQWGNDIFLLFQETEYQKSFCSCWRACVDNVNVSFSVLLSDTANERSAINADKSGLLSSSK